MIKMCLVMALFHTFILFHGKSFCFFSPSMSLRIGKLLIFQRSQHFLHALSENRMKSLHKRNFWFESKQKRTALVNPSVSMRQSNRFSFIHCLWLGSNQKFLYVVSANNALLCYIVSDYKFNCNTLRKEKFSSFRFVFRNKFFIRISMYK